MLTFVAGLLVGFSLAMAAMLYRQHRNEGKWGRWNRILDQEIDKSLNQLQRRSKVNQQGR